MKLCMPKVPKKYWVNQLTCNCKHCGCTFDILLPNSNDIVKLIEIGGNDIRWLPTYGIGGYIDLVTKLISNHNKNDEITMQKSRIFFLSRNTLLRTFEITSCQIMCYD